MRVCDVFKELLFLLPLYFPGSMMLWKMGNPTTIAWLLSLDQICKEGKGGSGRCWSHKGIRSALELPFHGPLLRDSPHLDQADSNLSAATHGSKGGNPTDLHPLLWVAPKKSEKGDKIVRHPSVQENSYFPGHLIICCPTEPPSGIPKLSMSLVGRHGCFGAETDLQM